MENLRGQYRTYRAQRKPSANPSEAFNVFETFDNSCLDCEKISSVVQNAERAKGVYESFLEAIKEGDSMQAIHTVRSNGAIEAVDEASNVQRNTDNDPSQTMYFPWVVVIFWLRRCRQSIFDTFYAGF